jgi:hypothetical protein
MVFFRNASAETEGKRREVCRLAFHSPNRIQMAVIVCSGAAGLGTAHFTVHHIVSCHHHDRMNSTSESSSPTSSPTILHPYERLKVLST